MRDLFTSDSVLKSWIKTELEADWNFKCEPIKFESFDRRFPKRLLDEFNLTEFRELIAVDTPIVTGNDLVRLLLILTDGAFNSFCVNRHHLKMDGKGRSWWLEQYRKDPNVGQLDIVDFSMTKSPTNLLLKILNIFTGYGYLKLWGLKIFNLMWVTHPYHVCSLTHNEIIRSGLPLNLIYKPYLEFLNTTKNFKYRGKEINWLRGISEKGGLNQYYRYLQHDETPANHSIAKTLLSYYLSQFKQWSNDSSYVEVNGELIYVDHHDIRDGSYLTRPFYSSGPYQRHIPVDVHPKDYYRETIRQIAQDTYREAGHVQYPEHFPCILDLTNSPHRQLVTGLDLVNEGNTMQHCVGGRDYRDCISDGTMLFFHLDIPDRPHGGTIAFERQSNPLRGGYILGGRYWIQDQFCGHDDEDLDYDDEAVIVRDKFIADYFLKVKVEPPKPTNPIPMGSVYDTYGGSIHNQWMSGSLMDIIMDETSRWMLMRNEGLIPKSIAVRFEEIDGVRHVYITKKFSHHIPSDLWPLRDSSVYGITEAGEHVRFAGNHVVHKPTSFVLGVREDPVLVSLSIGRINVEIPKRLRAGDIVHFVDPGIYIVGVSTTPIITLTKFERAIRGDLDYRLDRIDLNWQVMGHQSFNAMSGDFAGSVATHLLSSKHS